MPTQQLDSWFADTFGIDPGHFLAALKPPQPAAPPAADKLMSEEPLMSVEPETAANQSVVTDEAWLSPADPSPATEKGGRNVQSLRLGVIGAGGGAVSAERKQVLDVAAGDWGQWRGE